MVTATSMNTAGSRVDSIGLLGGWLDGVGVHRERAFVDPNGAVAFSGANLLQDDAGSWTGTQVGYIASDGKRRGVAR